MDKNNQRLTVEEREAIHRYLSCGTGQNEIARLLGRDKSVVSREIKPFKATGRPYSPILAQRSAERLRHGKKNRKLDSCPVLWEYVLARLRLRWSPQQISKALEKDYPDDKGMRVSHEGIYTYIYLLGRGELKKELVRCLRHKKPLRKGRKGTNDNRGRIADMVSIEERPAEVADRSVPGHWEGDLIIGKGHKSAMGTIVERTTRFAILVPLPDGRDAFSVREAFARALLDMPAHLRKTLTYDQGKEMAAHRLFTADTRMQVYFCHPASPWERGTCENTNMLVRDYFPKGTDFNQIPPERLLEVQHQLNERPRKTLGWKPPKQALRGLLGYG
jgi:IS30 family transposase